MKEEFLKSEKFKIVLAIILLAITFFISNYLLKSGMFIVLYVLLASELIENAIEEMKEGEIFNENTLMLIATAGAMFIGEFFEAIMVLLLYQIGESISDSAVENSKEAVTKLIDQKNTKAMKIVDEEVLEVEAKELEIDDIILIKAGDKIPIDGRVVEGSSEIDKSSLTGETLSETVKVGDEVFAGTINLDGTLKVVVTSLYKDTKAAQILEVIEEATQVKAKSEKFINKFSRYYTPAVIFAALMIVVIAFFRNGEVQTNDLYVALSFLVVSCPCALVISIPLAYFISIGHLSKKGILVKGSTFIDNATLVKHVFFDKTGTITHSKIQVAKVETYECDEKTVLKIVKSIESNFTHPIAKAILEYSSNQEIEDLKVEEVSNIQGFGVSAIVNGEKVLLGNEKLMLNNNVNIENVAKETGIECFIAVGNSLKGYILLNDTIKENAKVGIKRLKNDTKIKSIKMLTGDNVRNAKPIAEELKIDFKANLLPLEKVNEIKEIKNETKEKTLFVGDGINDSAVLAISDIGVAMGEIGSDIAIETADIVLLNDDINLINHIFKVSRFTKKIVIENILLSISLKMLALILIALGCMNMLVAVVADVGITIIAVLNALRILKVKLNK